MSVDSAIAVSEPAEKMEVVTEWKESITTGNDIQAGEMQTHSSSVEVKTEASPQLVTQFKVELNSEYEDEPAEEEDSSETIDGDQDQSLGDQDKMDNANSVPKNKVEMMSEEEPLPWWPCRSGEQDMAAGTSNGDDHTSKDGDQMGRMMPQVAMQSFKVEPESEDEESLPWWTGNKEEGGGSPGGQTSALNLSTSQDRPQPEELNSETNQPSTSTQQMDADLESSSFKGQLIQQQLLLAPKFPFVCNECGKAFSDASGLKKHKYVHSGERPYVCDICTKAFTRISNLKHHRMIHFGERPHVCDICSKAFTELSNLKKHRLKHSGERPFECETCGKAFTEAGSLKKHAVIHLGLRPHVCEVCQKGFTRASNLHSHMMIHAGHRPHVCDVCDRAFTESSNLKKHKLVHEEERRKMCDICSKTFTNLRAFQKHKLSHEGQQTHFCQLCNKVFFEEEHLNNHLLFHSGQRPYMCERCGRSFTQIGHLKQHELIHTGERPHVCEICNKGFHTISNLHKHRVVHTGERPFTCDICQMTFTQSSALNRHKLLHNAPRANEGGSSSGSLEVEQIKPPPLNHTGRRPHGCSTCEKSFSKISHLRQHEMIHTGNRPHVCDICNKGFQTVSNLHKHKAGHVGELPFVCDVCSMTFSQASALSQHKLLHNTPLVNKGNSSGTALPEKRHIPPEDEMEAYRRVLAQTSSAKISGLMNMYRKTLSKAETSAQSNVDTNKTSLALTNSSQNPDDMNAQSVSLDLPDFDACRKATWGDSFPHPPRLVADGPVFPDTYRHTDDFDICRRAAAQANNLVKQVMGEADRQTPANAPAKCNSNGE